MGFGRKMTLAAATMAVATAGMATAVPAQAHVSDGTAVGLGLLGLGVGAAIGSDHHRHRRYVDDEYYAPPPPPPPPEYAPPPPPPPPPSYSYEYTQRCRVIERWDPYWHGYRAVRRCD